jgi:hypothetical protein
MLSWWVTRLCYRAPRSGRVALNMLLGGHLKIQVGNRQSILCDFDSLPRLRSRAPTRWFLEAGTRSKIEGSRLQRQLRLSAQNVCQNLSYFEAQ